VALIVEGESTLNDATALVTLRMAIAAAGVAVFSPGEAILNFLVVSLGGISLGIAGGWAAVRILSWMERTRLADHRLDTRRESGERDEQATVHLVDALGCDCSRAQLGHETACGRERHARQHASLASERVGPEHRRLRTVVAHDDDGLVAPTRLVVQHELQRQRRDDDAGDPIHDAIPGYLNGCIAARIAGAAAAQSHVSAHGVGTDRRHARRAADDWLAAAIRQR
jgi:hypothetical protein